MLWHTCVNKWPFRIYCQGLYAIVACAILTRKTFFGTDEK